jgi:hypothetical protein
MLSPTTQASNPCWPEVEFCQSHKSLTTTMQRRYPVVNHCCDRPNLTCRHGSDYVRDRKNTTEMCVLSAHRGNGRGGQHNNSKPSAALLPILTWYEGADTWKRLAPIAVHRFLPLGLQQRLSRLPPPPCLQLFAPLLMRVLSLDGQALYHNQLYHQLRL